MCETCDQVLWCRAHDPWHSGGVNLPADHWGSARIRQPWTLFDNLQQILRLTDECPAGLVGDEMRRGACDLTEAASVHQRHRHRQRMLKSVARIQLGQTLGESAVVAWSPVLLRQLAAALSCEMRSAAKPD